MDILKCGRIYEIISGSALSGKNDNNNLMCCNVAEVWSTRGKESPQPPEVRLSERSLRSCEAEDISR